MPINSGKTPENAFTPAGLNHISKQLLENELGSVWVRGEVSNANSNQNLHIYFSLKDENASVSCAFFKNANFANQRVKNGDNLLVYGQVSLFEKTGNYQIIVKRIESSGIGDMAKAFAELKIKLESMGYFDPSKKKKIPSVINSIGIVASQSSAAVRDVLNVIKRRNPLLNVKIYHASVQGENAVGEIIDALLMADIGSHDAILLTRGGGSQEDLWTFNDVSIAQTLFNLSTPCVSAIGHERDTSISDLVADVSAITPSAAAELLTPDMENLKNRLENNIKVLQRNMQIHLNNYSQQLDINFHKLQKSHPKVRILTEKKELQNRFDKLKSLFNNQNDERDRKLNHVLLKLKKHDFAIGENKVSMNLAEKRIANAMQQKLDNNHNKIANLSHALDNLSPLSTLSRGYSITLKADSKSIIKSTDDVSVGDVIESIVDKGRIQSTVITTYHSKNKESR